MHTSSHNLMMRNSTAQIPATRDAPISLWSRNKILLFFIGILIFLWSGGFNLRVFYLSDRFEVFAIAAVFAASAGALLRSPFILTKGVSKNVYFWGIFGIIAIAWFSIFINSVVFSGRSFYEIPRQGFNYGGLLVFLVMISCRTDSSFVPSLNALIVGVSFLDIIGLIVASIVPGIGADLLMDTGSRFGRDRYVSPLELMVVYSTLYCMVMCADGARSNKNRLIFFAMLIIFVWYFLFVGMGRRTIIVFMLIASYYWLFHMKISRKAMALIVAFVLLMASLVFTNVGGAVFETVGNIFGSSVEEYQSNKGTVGIRIEGIKHYMNTFVDRGCIGIGPAKFSWSAARSEDILYNPNDHGLFAVLYQYGIPAVVLTLILLYVMFRDLRAVRRFGPMQYKPIAITMWLFLCFNIVSLSQIYWKSSSAQNYYPMRQPYPRSP